MSASSSNPPRRSKRVRGESASSPTTLHKRPAHEPSNNESSDDLYPFRDRDLDIKAWLQMHSIRQVVEEYWRTRGQPLIHSDLLPGLMDLVQRALRSASTTRQLVRMMEHLPERAIWESIVEAIDVQRAPQYFLTALLENLSARGALGSQEERVRTSLEEMRRRDQEDMIRFSNVFFSTWESIDPSANPPEDSVVVAVTRFSGLPPVGRSHCPVCLEEHECLAFPCTHKVCCACALHMAACGDSKCPSCRG